MMAFCQPLFVRPTDSDHDGLLSATFCPTDVGLSATASDDVGQLTLLVLMLLLLLVLVLVLRYDDDVGLSTTTSDDVGRLTLLLQLLVLVPQLHNQQVVGVAPPLA